MDDLRAKLSAQERSTLEEEQLRRQLTIEAIYHTNHIEGNRLTLPEVRAVVEAFWAERTGGVAADE
jgi:Fic family protein